MRFRSLLSLTLLVPLAVTGAAVMAAMYINADRRSTEMAHKLLAAVTAQAAQEVFAHSEHAVTLAHSLEKLGPSGLKLEDSDALALQLASLLRVNPNITWISFSNPQGRFTGAYRTPDGNLRINQSEIVDKKTKLKEHSVDAQNQLTKVRELEDSKYDPTTREFYTEAVKRGGLVWLPPYIFYEQGIPGISCAVPAYGPAHELLGVFSVDYDLHYLSAMARQLATPATHSQVMVFTDDKKLIAHSAESVTVEHGHGGEGILKSLGMVPDPATQGLMAHLEKIDLEALTPGHSESLDFEADGKAMVAGVSPMKLDEGPVMYVAAVAPKTDFAPTPWQSSKYAFLIALASFAAAGILAIWLAKRISAPIITLVRATERIGSGDLNVSVSLGSIREFKRLSTAFHAMLANLRDSVRVHHALGLAKEIQRRLLPIAPPQVPGFDIAGFSASCDETGGDYYDFLQPDAEEPSRFIVALGDMMGHGLPSALLMAGARGALRSALNPESTPAGLLTQLNDVFFQDTEGSRFMTMCVVSFDLERGSMVWGSAGHDPPLIYDPVAKGFHEPEGGDLPLGVIAHVDYVDYRFDAVNAGQIIIIGSDGIWETYSSAGEQFGKERLKTVVELNAQKSAEEIKEAVLAALAMYRGTEPVHDDVTFVVLKVLPLPASARRQNSQASPEGLLAGR